MLIGSGSGIWTVALGGAVIPPQPVSRSATAASPSTDLAGAFVGALKAAYRRRGEVGRMNPPVCARSPRVIAGCDRCARAHAPIKRVERLTLYMDATTGWRVPGRAIGPEHAASARKEPPQMS